MWVLAGKLNPLKLLWWIILGCFILQEEKWQKMTFLWESCTPHGYKFFSQTKHLGKGFISIIAATVLTLSLLNFFCLVAGAPGRRRGHVALPAGLHPDWRRLQQGRGQRTARRRWLLRFSGDWTPKSKEIQKITNHINSMGAKIWTNKMPN